MSGSPRRALTRNLQQLLDGQSSSPKDGDSFFKSSHRQTEVVSPYLTTASCVEYLRLPSRAALYYHIRENGLPTCRCGGSLRFDRRDLDAWLRGTHALELVRTRKKTG